MKKLFLCLTLLSVIFFFVSCGSSKKEDQNDSDDQQNDEDVVDTDSPDTEPDDTGSSWKTSDSEFISLDKLGLAEQVLPKLLKTDDGKIIVTWLRPELNNAGYFLHLQIFDKNGTPMFPEEGVVVSSKKTPGYTTDYSLAFAPNGDILIAYGDSRNDTEGQELIEVYVYRYNQKGEPVWDKDGIKVVTEKINSETPAPQDLSPSFCVSDKNIYLSVFHVEEDNRVYQIFKLKEDGTPEWTSPLKKENKYVFIAPSSKGNAYLIYVNAKLGLDAKVIDAAGKDVWEKPVTIEKGEVVSEVFMAKPVIVPEDDGSIFISYRRLIGMTGYYVLNKISADGSFVEDVKSCSSSEENNIISVAMGVRDHKALLAWEEIFEDKTYAFSANLFDAKGNTVWGENYAGVKLDTNDVEGIFPDAVIPQSDGGWVILYERKTNWNTADLMLQKIDKDGQKVWQRQIGTKSMDINEVAVEYDSTKAYIFYTMTVMDDQFNDKDSSAFRAMCVDLTKGE